MSVFLCSDKHKNTLINYAEQNSISFYHNEEYHAVKLDPEGYALMLHYENMHSFESRYGSDGTIEELKYKKFPITKVRVVQIIKACHCYNYQVNDTRDYKETEASALISSIIDQATHVLPGYDTAVWGIRDIK